MIFSIGWRRVWGAALVGATATMVGCGGVPVERNGPAQERSVRRTWNETLPVVRSAVIEAFERDRRRTLPDPFNQMVAVELTLPGYSPDWLVTYVDPGDFLKDYKALPASVRNNDLWVEDPIGDTYWRSEYQGPDGPVRFRCGFILHFADATAGTTIEAYESVPEIWAGEHWAWAMHGIGFSRFHDIRFVEPTVHDRIRVLDLIDEILKKR
jgi:hypothetical protein